MSSVQTTATAVVLSGTLVLGMGLRCSTSEPPHPTGERNPAYLAAAASEQTLFVTHEMPMEQFGNSVPMVLLDAGHGAPSNSGNISSFCVAEEDFTRLLAYDVYDLWADTRLIDPELTRQDAGLVPYADRVAQLERLGADFFISFHSDVRAKGWQWRAPPEVHCLAELEHPGYVVIYADEGAADLVSRRKQLALAISRRMKQAGFLPYLGGYAGLYQASAEDEAVIVDRHEPTKRIYLLRATTVPAVLIETHNALDFREARAWEEESTRRAFAFAVGQAVLDQSASSR